MTALRVGVVACFISLAAGCPTSSTTTTPEPAQKATAEQTQKKLNALIEKSSLASASPDERRVALRIASLHKLREQMQAVVAQLPKEKEAAEATQEELQGLQARLGDATVKAAMKQAAAELDAAQKSEAASSNPDAAKAKTLLQQAKAIDGQLDAAMHPEPRADGDSMDLRQLKEELARQQRATLQLAAATRAAFRALSVLPQMHRAVAILREHGKRESAPTPPAAPHK